MSDDQKPATPSRALTPVESALRDIGTEKFKQGIAVALPPGVDPDRFVRVIMTAIRQKPELANYDRNSLFNSALRAAQDGLLPDGREGAFVKFNTKIDDKWVDAVQWMPMIAGIRKRLAGCGISLESEVVYENDFFERTLGDDAKITHVPPKLGTDRGKPIGAYAIARTADGMVFREVMDVQQIEKVRAASKSKDKGPWVDWWDEMARKAVARRLSKSLPITDPKVAETLTRDDNMYDFDRNTGETAAPATRTTAAAAVNAKVAGNGSSAPQPRTDDKGVIEGESRREPQAGAGDTNGTPDF